MIYKIYYSAKARSQIKSFDLKLSQRIARKLRFYVNTGKPLKYAKKLTNSSIGKYRFRIGNYRVLFDIDKNGNIAILYILSIKHRRQAYC